MNSGRDINPAINRGRDGIYLNVHVQPGAKTNAIRGMYGDAIKLSITVSPQDGKANRALIQFVAKLLDIPRAEVQLISGQTSRQKRLFISGRPDRLIRQIQSWV